MSIQVPHTLPTLAALAALAAAVSSSGCGAAVGKNVNDEVEGRLVNEVSITGNQVFDDEDIIERLAHRPPPPWWWPFGELTYFDSLAVRVDARRIAAYYKERGYFNARVIETVPKLRGDDQVNLRFKMFEGEPARVAQIALRGAADVAADAARRELAASSLREGAVFVHVDYLALKEAVRLAHVARGYAYAKVGGQVVVDREANTVAVELTAFPGPRVRFGEVIIEGAEGVPRSAIRKRIVWKEGQVFDQRLLDETRKRLLSFGVFTSVRLDYPKEGQPERVDMRVRVSEGSRNELKLGGGLAFDSDDLTVRGRLSYARKLWLDPLATWRLDFRPGYVVWTKQENRPRAIIDVLARYERPDFLFYRLGLGVLLGYDLEAFEAYSVKGPRGGVNLSYSLFDQRLVFGGGWQLRQLSLDTDGNDALAAALEFPDPYRLGSFTQSVVLDLRDDRLAPRLGALAQLQLEEGTAAAGGVFGYLKGVGDVRLYAPLGDRLVLAGRARLGTMRPTDGGPTPITQRFYGGGASGHRGFLYRELSPSIASEGELLPVGGDALVLGSGELRIDLTRLGEEWLRAGLFTDVGDVTDDLDQLDIGQLHWAAGVGLRYDTPVGPIRLDVARRLNRTGVLAPDGTSRNAEPKKLTVFHLSIGEAF